MQEQRQDPALNGFDRCRVVHSLYRKIILNRNLYFGAHRALVHPGCFARLTPVHEYARRSRRKSRSVALYIKHSTSAARRATHDVRPLLFVGQHRTIVESVRVSPDHTTSKIS